MNDGRSFTDLLQDLRAGDELAAKVIVDEYTDALVAVARRQMGSKLARRVDPEDIIQSTYRSLFVRMQDGEYELGDGHDLWKLLVTMTLNKVRRKAKFHRTARRDMAKDQSLGAEAVLPAAGHASDRGPSPEDAAELVDELQTVLERLKPSEREIVELRLQGCSTSEISQETGRAERSVRRVLQHLGERLQKSMEL
jgi:RNA polymerase sigma-70 factor (ECF subfamily)